jgi:hypothetical protein
VQLLLGWEISAAYYELQGGGKSTRSSPAELVMSTRSIPAEAAQTREQRIEAIMQQLRPKLEEKVRQLVERAVDVPEAEEFGAIDFEFRDAGQELVNAVRQASVASRKKRATSAPA